MKPFNKIYHGLDISSAIDEIKENDYLFGEFNARKDFPGSPHSEMSDIWVRYGDISEMIESGDYSEIANEHDSIWFKDLPEVKNLCFKLMSLLTGRGLGASLSLNFIPALKYISM